MAVPTVTLVSPANGAAVAPDAVVVLEVTVATALRRVVLVAKMPGAQLWEAIHDGDAFGPAYLGSTRAAIAGGFRYTIRRAVAWPSAPTLWVAAVDTNGDEA